MTAPAEISPSEPGGAAEKPAVVILGKFEKTIAALLIAFFVIFIGVLVTLRSSENWDRLIYLFGGLEALVFTAAGALFGAGIQRGQTRRAEDAADRERERADTNQSQANHGAALAATIRAKLAQGGGGPEGRGARPGPDRAPAPGGALTELGQLADEWFPRARR